MTAPPPPLHDLPNLPVWHSVLFRNSLWLTYVSPALLKKGVLWWVDLVDGRKIPEPLQEKLAPTWQTVYAAAANSVASMYREGFEPPPSPPLDQWGVQWTKQRMLLFLQQRKRPKARQPPEVWRVYNKLFLPRWDLDFIKRVLWRKLPVGVRQERMGGKMCPLDGRVEDHQHVLKRCFFLGFMFDTVRKAFVLVPWEGGSMEPSRLLLDAPLLSMQPSARRTGSTCGVAAPRSSSPPAMPAVVGAVGGHRRRALVARLRAAPVRPRPHHAPAAPPQRPVGAKEGKGVKRARRQVPPPSRCLSHLPPLLPRGTVGAGGGGGGRCV